MIWKICILLALAALQISFAFASNMETQMILDELEIIKSKYDSLRKQVDDLNQNKSPQFKSIFDVRIDSFPEECETTALPSNCAEATACTRQSGIYKLMITELNNKSVLVYCDERTDGGGWTVIQMRTDGSEKFHRSWQEYTNGFGNVDAEHWLGLDNIYALTNFQGPQELYIHLEDFEGSRRYAKYDHFVIGNEKENFKLKSLGLYRGTAGDSFTEFNLGMEFSTYDRDHDKHPDVKINCALERDGAGWWFNQCAKLNLNGKYHYNGNYTGFHNGIYYLTWRGVYYSHRHVKMMIRRQRK